MYVAAIFQKLDHRIYGSRLAVAVFNVLIELVARISFERINFKFIICNMSKFKTYSSVRQFIL